MPASDRGQAGWLSNLLAAASRDEPEAATPRGEETSGSADPGNLRPHRQRGRDGNVGSMETRRHRRRFAPPLHRGRPTGVRRNPAPLSRRPAVPRYDDALYAGIRTPAWRRSARATAMARSGAPIFCRTPARSTRSLRTPRVGSGRAGTRKSGRRFFARARCQRILEHDAISRNRIMLESAVARFSAVGGEDFDARSFPDDQTTSSGARAHAASGSTSICTVEWAMRNRFAKSSAN